MNQYKKRRQCAKIVQELVPVIITHYRVVYEENWSDWYKLPDSIKCFKSEINSVKLGMKEGVSLPENVTIDFRYHVE